MPYLSQPILHRQRPHPLNQHMTRLLSTETKRYVKEQFWLATKWTAILWTFLFLGGMVYYGISVEKSERENPTPSEWKFLVRRTFANARASSSQQVAEQVGYIDWAAVGSRYLKVLLRLEDPNYEGKGLIEGAGQGEDIMIEGVGKAGFDVSAKSWPWRAGYFETIMGCAKAAEHVDSMVLDKTRGLVFPKAVMIGPSNPDPRPTPPYMASAPREEDCTRPFDPPETFYMRVLTGRGFTTKQRMEAASAYANWLEFKGLQESAEEMYRWNVDIAKDALEVDSEEILDSKTGVLRQSDSTSAHVTPNLLRATTDLAIFKARTGDVASALPMLLSVLRARRAAPVSPFPPPIESTDESASGKSKLWKILSPPRFPPSPPSGDNPIIRSSDTPTCDESELMLYIGEILFATSPQSDEGLAWTRQAVQIADQNSAPQGRSPSPGLDAAAERKKCKECLLTGVSNWDAMLTKLASQQSPSKKSWFSWGGGASMDRISELEDERRRLEIQKECIARDAAADRPRAISNPSGVWIG